MVQNTYIYICNLKQFVIFINKKVKLVTREKQVDGLLLIVHTGLL